MEVNKIPRFIGYISLKSHLTLEELGEVLSKNIFGGAIFSGKEKSIHEEIPAIFIEKSFMGTLVILDGYSGFEDDKWFTITIQMWGDFNQYIYSNKIKEEKTPLHWYLYYLIKQGLTGYPEIQIIEPRDTI